MTEPRTPDQQPASSDPGSIDSPTQAWPSLTTPPAATPPAATPSDPTPSAVAPSAAVPSAAGPTAAGPTAAGPTAAGPTAASSSPDPSPYEPTTSLPGNRVSTVGESGTFGAATGSSRRGIGLRWMVAILGVILVAAASIVVISLVGAKAPVSTVMGYMPDQVMSYTEVRLDLPGDQRQKLASFLKPIPGFDDSSQFDTKLNELLDRFVAAASDHQQTWTADIAPWFGGQIAIGSSIPSSTQSTPAMANTATLAVISITDRAKAIAWIEKVADAATINRSTYGDADLLLPTAGQGAFAIAVNDKVAIAGSVEAVKAAVDSGGKSSFSNADDVKAALGTIDKDYVMLGVTRVKAMADAAIRLMGQTSPTTAAQLDQTQLDETVLAMVPAWFANTARFENDSLVMTSVGPAGSIGYDTSNHADQVLSHIPASTLLVTSEHDVGPALSALVGKFRGLPEASDFFRQFDQALGLLGGFDGVFGWWGDTAVVVSKVPDGTIGGGLVIKPRDAAAADRFMTSINSFAALGGSSAGATVRTADHNGTKVTVLDFSAATGQGSLPPGYKAEIAWAANADIAVVGYGEGFVNSVLDSGPGSSLADDARFKGLLDRAGAENIAVSFVDLKAIRSLVEPLAQSMAPATAWDQYVKNIQPYLAPIDALIATGRKDGSLDRGVTIVTTPR